MNRWKNAGALVVIFTHFAPKRPGSVWLRAAVLTLCVAAAMFGWQAQPGEPPHEADSATVGPPTPVAPPFSLPDHKILPNDLLSSSVYDEPELSRNLRVDPDGKITVPQLTDKLQAAGLMPREIEKEISSALIDGQILLHPIVAVSIAEYAERSISVVGDVRNPGQFKMTSPISLLEALAKAGWVTNDAGPEILLTTPDTPEPRKINLRDLQMSTDRTLNVLLKGGEIVSVPDAQKELAARFPEGPKIWITGNVAHPMVYSITNPADATVLKVIAGAGGVTQNSAKTAWIYRIEGTGNRRSVSIPLADIMHRKAKDVTLQADDVLLVPDSDTKKMQEYYETHPLTAPWEKAK
jgi:polysaccharide export outer membrane protein